MALDEVGVLSLGAANILDLVVQKTTYTPEYDYIHLACGPGGYRCVRIRKDGSPVGHEIRNLYDNDYLVGTYGYFDYLTENPITPSKLDFRSIDFVAGNGNGAPDTIFIADYWSKEILALNVNLPDSPEKIDFYFHPILDIPDIWKSICCKAIKVFRNIDDDYFLYGLFQLDTYNTALVRLLLNYENDAYHTKELRGKLLQGNADFLSIRNLKNVSEDHDNDGYLTQIWVGGSHSDSNYGGWVRKFNDTKINKVVELAHEVLIPSRTCHPQLPTPDLNLDIFKEMPLVASPGYGVVPMLTNQSGTSPVWDKNIIEMPVLATPGDPHDVTWLRGPHPFKKDIVSFYCAVADGSQGITIGQFVLPEFTQGPPNPLRTSGHLSVIGRLGLSGEATRIIEYSPDTENDQGQYVIVVESGRRLVQIKVGIKNQMNPPEPPVNTDYNLKTWPRPVAYYSITPDIVPRRATSLKPIVNPQISEHPPIVPPGNPRHVQISRIKYGEGSNPLDRRWVVVSDIGTVSHLGGFPIFVNIAQDTNELWKIRNRSESQGFFPVFELPQYFGSTVWRHIVTETIPIGAFEVGYLYFGFARGTSPFEVVSRPYIIKGVQDNYILDFINDAFDYPHEHIDRFEYVENIETYGHDFSVDCFKVDEQASELYFVTASSQGFGLYKFRMKTAWGQQLTPPFLERIKHIFLPDVVKEHGGYTQVSGTPCVLKVVAENLTVNDEPGVWAFTALGHRGVGVIRLDCIIDESDTDPQLVLRNPYTNSNIADVRDISVVIPDFAEDIPAYIFIADYNRGIYVDHFDSLTDPIGLSGSYPQSGVYMGIYHNFTAIKARLREGSNDIYLCCIANRNPQPGIFGFEAFGDNWSVIIIRVETNGNSNPSSWTWTFLLNEMLPGPANSIDFDFIDDSEDPILEVTVVGKDYNLIVFRYTD
jgi:hypothetical protein